SDAECPGDKRICPMVQAFVTFEARMYSLGAGGDFFHTKGHLGIVGYKGHFQFFANSSADVGTPLWSEDDFDVDDPEQEGEHVLMFFHQPGGLALDIDLSPVTLGELFAVE